jgi:hypothetical protein
MAVKNLKTVAVCVAEVGVRVTGTGSMRTGGKRPAPLSLPGQPLPGYPIPAAPDAELLADNAAAARAVTRVGRSVSGSVRLARLASGIVLSKRSRPMFSVHRERQSMCCETW